MPRNAATNRFKLKEIPASISFNGSTTTVAYTGAGVTGFASASSFAGWVKISRGSSTTRITVGRWGAGGSDRCGICFQQVSPLGSENYALQAGYYNGSTYTVSGTTNVPIETWFHLAFTWDGTTARSYINGTLLTGTSASPASGVTTGLSLGNQGGAFWRGNQSMAKLYTRVLTQDEITKLSLMQDDQVDTTGLWVDWRLDEGAGSSVTDYSGNSRTGTITSGTFVYDSPMKARKLINGNMVRNGDFEYAPPFTAATNTASRWIDGTAAGSTTNDLFGWFMSPSWTGTDGTASFDSSVFYSGAYSLKINKTSATGGTSGGAVGLGTLVSPTVAVQRQYFIPVTPSTDYRLVFRLKTDSISALNAAGARMRALMYDGVNTSSTSSASSSYVTGTNDWQQITLSFTTTATTRLINPWCQLDNETGTAWFDDISLTPVYPEGRVPANGNLVKNFDFEVAPTFVAATNTASRWIDGTAAGSSTNITYKWGIISGSTAGTFSSQFDTSTAYAGSASLKLSTGATGSSLDVGPLISGSASTVVTYGIPVLPNTSYTGTYRMKTTLVSGSATTGAKLNFNERDSAYGNSVANEGASVLTTTDWTLYTVTFTTAATTTFVVPRLRVKGNDGAATLIMDAWFDDIYLAPTSTPARVADPMQVPTDISNCALWLNAESGVTLNGSTVSSWVDKSRRGVVYTQATASQQPTFIASSANFNNHSVIQSDGGDVLHCSALNIAGAKTVFLVYRFTTIPSVGNTAELFTLADSGKNSFSECLALNALGGYETISFKHDFAASAASVGHSLTLNTNTRLLEQTYNGGTNTATGSYTSTFEGSSQSLAASGAFARVSGDFASLFSRSNSSGNPSGSGAQMEIAEFIVYSRVLSASEKSAVRSYLALKYSISI